MLVVVTIVILGLGIAGVLLHHHHRQPAAVSHGTRTVKTDQTTGARASRDQRLWDVRAGVPALDEDETQDLLNQSDRLIAAMDAEGIENRSRYLRHELERMEVTEDEMRAYYDAHRDVFGERSFEQAHSALSRLTRIRKLRSQIESTGSLFDGEAMGGSAEATGGRARPDGATESR